MKIRMEDYASYDDFLQAFQAEQSRQIDLDRLDVDTYMALVLWLHGRFTVNQIADALRMKLGRVTSCIRSRQYGGYLPTDRSTLEIEDRQRLLDHLKAFRMDDGKLPDAMFVAIRK